VSVKNKLNNCESEPIEIIIEGYKCNYIIHPEKFVFLEKSLDKFKDDNSVEVFIFNRNGNLVFNKIIATSEKFYWEGNSNTNLSTPMGNYTYLIKSGKKVSKGEITIIR
jgi:flagellar hook assembly protein FlgD